MTIITLIVSFAKILDANISCMLHTTRSIIVLCFFIRIVFKVRRIIRAVYGSQIGFTKNLLEIDVVNGLTESAFNLDKTNSSLNKNKSLPPAN